MHSRSARTKQRQRRRLCTAGAAVAACTLVVLFVWIVFPPPDRSNNRRVGATLGVPAEMASPPLPQAHVFRSPDVVHAHEPHEPMMPQQHRRVFPSTSGGGEAAGGGCVAWRQTGECSPRGPREAIFDRPCSATIFAGPSGFCDCGGGVRGGLTTCASHPPFTCAEVCASEAASRPDSDGIDIDIDAHAARAAPGVPPMNDADHQLDSVVRVHERLYAADQFLAARAAAHIGDAATHGVTSGSDDGDEVAGERRLAALRKALQAAQSGARGDAPHWQLHLGVARSVRELAVARLVAGALHPASSDGATPITTRSGGAAAAPAAAACVMWRQTSGCAPHGRREPSLDRPCRALIPDGLSGFCECAGGRRSQGVTCSHRPFTCVQMCSAASAIDASRRGASPLSEHRADVPFFRTAPRAASGGGADAAHLAAVAAIRSGGALAGHAVLRGRVLAEDSLAAMDEHVSAMMAHRVRAPQAHSGEGSEPRSRAPEKRHLLALSAGFEAAISEAADRGFSH